MASGQSGSAFWTRDEDGQYRGALALGAVHTPYKLCRTVLVLTLGASGPAGPAGPYGTCCAVLPLVRPYALPLEPATKTTHLT